MEFSCLCRIRPVWHATAKQSWSACRKRSFSICRRSRARALVKTLWWVRPMTAPAPAPPLTAAHPLIPPPTTAGATWPISRPQCWTPPPPQTLPSSQRQILKECTSDTTVRFMFFLSFLSAMDFKNRYSITKSCMHFLRIYLLFFLSLHTLYHRVCLNQLWHCFTFFLTKFLF